MRPTSVVRWVSEGSAAGGYDYHCSRGGNDAYRVLSPQPEKSIMDGVLLRYKQNLHIHTTYAGGKDTPEEMVCEAIARGVDSIGFSEHSYISFSSACFVALPQFPSAVLWRV